MQSALGAPSIKRYHPLIELETRPFIRRLVADPTHYVDHIRRYTGGLTLFVVYGHQVQSNDDHFLRLAEECVDLLSNHISSGGGIWPVDVFPFRPDVEGNARGAPHPKPVYSVYRRAAPARPAA